METTQIKAGTTLSVRSVGDHDCVFTVAVLSRTAKTVTVNAQGIVRRCKIHIFDGVEAIFAFGQYSMAPLFRATSAQGAA